MSWASNGGGVAHAAVVVELDEMWHFLGTKSNKVWIWKAYKRETGKRETGKRETGKLIDWECGGRDAETFGRLLTRLQRWKVRLYCTDAFVVYEQMLAPGTHYQGKKPDGRAGTDERATASLDRSIAAALDCRFQINGDD